MTDTEDPGTETAIVPTSVTLDEHTPDFHVSELVSVEAGAASPFGPEAVFPLPVDTIWYTHPGPADRPNLAGGL